MNYSELTEETENLFKERIRSKHLENLRFGFLCDSDQKMTDNQMCGKVVINKGLVRERYKEDAVIIINEDVFIRLNEKHQIIMIDKLLAYVEYDMDKDRVKKKTPDIQEHSGILMTYQFMELQSLSSEVQRIYNELDEENTKNNGKKA